VLLPRPDRAFRPRTVALSAPETWPFALYVFGPGSTSCCLFAAPAGVCRDEGRSFQFYFLVASRTYLDSSWFIGKRDVLFFVLFFESKSLLLLILGLAAVRRPHRCRVCKLLFLILSDVGRPTCTCLLCCR